MPTTHTEKGGYWTAKGLSIGVYYPWVTPSSPTDLVASKDCNTDLTCNFLIQNWWNDEWWHSSKVGGSSNVEEQDSLEEK